MNWFKELFFMPQPEYLSEKTVLESTDEQLIDYLHSSKISIGSGQAAVNELLKRLVKRNKDKK